MKTKIPILALSVAIIIVIFTPCIPLNSATITRGYTFSTNEQVTAAKLHSLVDAATLSGLVAADIPNLSVSNGKLGANSVTSDKILDATIVSTDIMTRGLVGTELATNAVTGIELSTNITLRAGNFDPTLTTWAANSVPASAVVGVTTSAGAADSGKIPKLNASGLLDTTFTGGSSTRSQVLVVARAAGSAYTWTTMTNITTTGTSGSVVINGRALGTSVGGSGWIRVRDVSTNIIARSQCSIGAGGYGAPVLECTGHDSLSGVAKTYYLDVSSSGGTEVFTNAQAVTGSSPVISGTNNFGLFLLETQ